MAAALINLLQLLDARVYILLCSDSLSFSHQAYCNRTRANGLEPTKWAGQISISYSSIQAL
jgi:hypothetical protein